MNIALILMYLLVPAAVIYLCQKIPALEKIGVVVLSFGMGILLAFSGVLPTDETTRSIQENVSGVSVILAISLLIFSIDVLAAMKLGGRTMLGLFFAIISVVTMSMVGAVIFHTQLDSINHIAGMAVGAYVGGGPNMAAIRTAINADYDLWVTMNTYDLLLSSMFVLFVITLAKPIFKHLLPAFKQVDEVQKTKAFDHLAEEGAASYSPLANLKLAPKTVLALLLSIVILAVSIGVSKLFPEGIDAAVLIITVTCLGVAASFVPAVRRLPNSYPLGMYLILVFCFAAGSMADTRIFTELNIYLFAYISMIIFGAFLMQFVLCRIFKVDVDTFLITGSAAIMSVPFIPVIAGALKNKAILVPGFAAAIIGYILGNYLGIAVSWVLQSGLLF